MNRNTNMVGNLSGGNCELSGQIISVIASAGFLLGGFIFLYVATH